MTGSPLPDASQSSSAAAAGSGSSGGPPAGPTNDLDTEFVGSVVQRCDIIVEDFRKGKINKAKAIIDLLEAFAFERSRSAEEKEIKRSAFQAYTVQLDEAETDERRAAERGRQPESTGAGVRPSGEAAEAGPPEPDSDEVGPRAITRRARGADESEDDGDESDERPRRKKQVDESLFPFGHDGAIGNLSPVLRKTLTLKANYMRDLPLSKQTVLIQPNVPSLPDSLWNDVLKNDYVDLDKIFASVFSVSSDPKQVLKFGDLELEAIVPRVERKIVRHGDWTVAWAKYEKAVYFTYPHRLDELREYYEHVTGLFTSVDVSQEWRVINYDKAIRQEAGKSNAYLLTDFGRFNKYFSRFLVGSGGRTQNTASQAESSGRTQKSASTEICRKYNDGRCSSKQCRYRHVCSKCGGKDHAVTACSTARSSEGKK